MDDDNRHGADADDSDLHFEVTPLVPPQPGRALPPPRRSRARAWRTLAVGAALIVALAVLLGSLAPVRSALFGRAPILVSKAPHALVASPTVGTLGDVPTGCPPGNGVETFSSAYGPGVGIYGLHIWLVGFSGPTATLHLAGAVRTARGWPAKLIVAAAPDVTQPLALSVQAFAEGTVWLSPDGPNAADVTLPLDPAATPPSSDGWRSWPLQLFVPSAGCYYFDIRYGGHVTPGTYFAAGK